MFLSLTTLISDSELKVVGEYGLRNKREVWRVQLTLSKIRRAARYVHRVPSRREYKGEKVDVANKIDQ